MIIWDDLVSTMRSSMLRDNPEDLSEVEWTDDNLLAYCRWALDEFAQHTALPVEVIFQDGMLKPNNTDRYDMTSDTLFHLPKLPHGDFMTTSAVCYVTTAGKVGYMKPNNSRQIGIADSYYTFEPTSLRVTATGGAGTKLVVRYFGYYDHPTGIGSEINIPEWAEGPIAYRMCLHAMTNTSVENSGIRQWDQTGNRELSPMKAHQQWLLKMYDDVLSRHTPQNRQISVKP